MYDYEDILASFVPQIVQQEAALALHIAGVKDKNLTPKETNLPLTCIAVADLSGFTKYCEECSKEGAIGVEKLTTSLNSAMGRMVKNVESYGGDILKVTVTWVCMHMHDTLFHSISCHFPSSEYFPVKF
jgi:hypothetical protein